MQIYINIVEKNNNLDYTKNRKIGVVLALLKKYLFYKNFLSFIILFLKY